MAIDLSTLSVLIVEDTLPMQKLLSSLLQSLGFKKPYLSSNGKEGYEAYQRYHPDIVISDWMMDKSDGLDLTRRIRTHPSSLNKVVPIILITGYSSLGRVRDARDAGVTEFLIKPFTAADIAKRISYVINNPRDFISTRTFFGPDRRRKRLDEYNGPKRRVIEDGIKQQDQSNGWNVSF